MAATRTDRLSPRLLSAWRRSSYEAAGAVARIGWRSPAIDRLLVEMGTREAAFVGAWNPAGRRATPARNRLMQCRLLALTAALPRRTGHGGRGRWREPHLLLAIPPRRAVVIARRFKQGGLVLVRRGRAARLMVLT